MRDAHGRFLPGADDDRHELTTAERKRGYAHATARLGVGDARVYAWLYRRIRGFYRRRRRLAAAAVGADDAA